MEPSPGSGPPSLPVRDAQTDSKEAKDNDRRQRTLGRACGFVCRRRKVAGRYLFSSGGGNQRA